MKRFQTLICVALLGACGSSDSDPDSALQNDDGKLDGFSGRSELVISGARSETIVLDDPFQCEMSQFNTLGGWHNSDRSTFDFPTFRLTMTNNGGRLPKSGDVVDGTKTNTRLIFDGVGFSSEGTEQCDLQVDEFLNEGAGKRAGVAISITDCVMQKDGSNILVSGAFSCIAPGFDLLFEPDPEPDPDPDPNNQNPDNNTQLPTETCDLAVYDAWLTELETMVTARTVNQIELQSHVDALACVPISPEPFANWLALFDARVDAALTTVTSDEQQTLSKVIAGAPRPVDSESYVAYFAVYEKYFKRFLPQNSSSIDSNERIALDLVVAAKPDVADAAAFNAWAMLYSARITLFLPQNSSSLDSNERAQIAELLLVQPASTSDAAWVAWFEVYDRYFALAVPSTSSSIDSTERTNLETIATHAPQVEDAATAYPRWVERFRTTLDRTGTSVDSSEQAVIAEALKVKPCGDAEEAAEAYNALVAEHTDKPTADYASGADPTICE